MKLNLGCGQIRPEGWINTDSSISSLLQKIPFSYYLLKILGARKYDSSNMKYMNLNKRWSSIKSGTVDIVYASHLFEHLTLKSRDLFLQESFRTMKKGAVIRLVVPDLELHAREYVEELNKGNKNANEQFLWALNLHREGQYPVSLGLHRILGYIQNYPHQHKYMYDQFSLTKLLTEAGFSNIHLSSFGLSQFIPEINQVEFDESFSYGNSLYLEAKKA